MVDSIQRLMSFHVVKRYFSTTKIKGIYCFSKPTFFDIIISNSNVFYSLKNPLFQKY